MKKLINLIFNGTKILNEKQVKTSIYELIHKKAKSKIRFKRPMNEIGINIPIW